MWLIATYDVFEYFKPAAKFWAVVGLTATYDVFEFNRFYSSLFFIIMINETMIIL